ncbi:MAG: deoxyribodipyrimidine photo-lyase [Phycisphaeraceae bacterium]|nr:deoxyribodipyrimidine photo-lyase [Phycisphaeraceae bacterium]
MAKGTAGNSVGGGRTLVWFRTDLRCADNAALASAAAGGRRVVGLWVVSPGEWAAHDWAACKVDLALRTAAELSRTLAGLNIPLLVRRAERPGDVAGVVRAAAAQVKATEVHANIEYEVNEGRRDSAAGAALLRDGVALRLHHDQAVIEPGAVRPQSGGPFTVFSPFKRAWWAELERRGGVREHPAPKRQAATGIEPEEVPRRVDGFDSAVPAALWPAGEGEAQRRLERFIARGLGTYKDLRDRCDLDGTSAISPYLACGAISARRCFRLAAEANGGRWDRGGDGPVHWMSELIWREFYRHILVAFPRVCKHRAFKPATDRIAWRDNPRDVEAWKAGRTGYPIVDAAMRCLAATGWMHNRLRMIAAMFLTKDLLVDWRIGERHFMRSLVDGDLASNNGGWQWSASTGTDAAPYFRIFNPFSQSAKTDPEGTFIRRWVPELAGVKGPEVHDPRGLPALLRSGLDYPEPIVDHDAARARVMSAFKGLAAGA